MDMTKVTLCLMEDPVLLNSYVQFLDLLGIPTYLKEDLKLKSSAPFYEKIRCALDAWRSSNALPTLEALIEILRNGGFRFAAENIGQMNGIHKGSSCTAPVDTLLRLKWWPEENPLVKSFVERAANGIPLVDRLHTMLNDQSEMTSFKACITGFGITGKSTLAKWYANNWIREYDCIIWLDCGENSLYKSINRLWENLSGTPKSEKPSCLADVMKECFKAFVPHPMLVIYDNAEDYAGNQGIKQALPSFQLFPNIKCLITSRWTEWGTSDGHGEIPQLSLQTFSVTESINFFEKNLRSLQPSKKELEELSELLDYLPLALQIALGQLKHTPSHIGGEVARYTKTLRRSMEGFLYSKTYVDDYNKGFQAVVLEAKGNNVTARIPWTIGLHYFERYDVYRIRWRCGWISVFDRKC